MRQNQLFSEYLSRMKNERPPLHPHEYWVLFVVLWLIILVAVYGITPEWGVAALLLSLVILPSSAVVLWIYQWWNNKAPNLKRKNKKVTLYE